MVSPHPAQNRRCCDGQWIRPSTRAHCCTRAMPSSKETSGSKPSSVRAFSMEYVPVRLSISTVAAVGSLGTPSRRWIVPSAVVSSSAAGVGKVQTLPPAIAAILPK